MKRPAALRLCTLLLAAAVVLPARAFLPDTDVAIEAIDALPAVQAAQARAREAGARGDALRSSPYGYELTLMPLARHERAFGTYGEIETTLMRRLRLPDKARLDDALANAGDELARFALGDARHTGALRLLEAWVAWVRAAHVAVLAERQRAVHADAQRAVARRVELGEMAVLDERRAAAALADAELVVARALLAREQARLAIASEFPALRLPPEPPPVAPPTAQGPAADAVELIVHHNHDLLMAQVRAARQRLAAARADAERRPDPSMGLRILGEGDGREQAVGVVVTIPFATRGQRAVVRAEHALGEAVEVEAAGLERRVRLDAEQLTQALAAQYAAWSAAARLVEAADDTLVRLEKAWRLGAVDQQDLLLARRQAYEARLNEFGLRLDAQALAARIDIDSHRRWALDTNH